ncbi:MAG: TonB family protein [Cytophagales bacterium]|nr:TonB family protein [Cytophagales bacterium]
MSTELKKNPEFDVHRRRALYFNVGLFCSLFFVTFAFNWRTYDAGITDLGELEDVFEEPIEIPPTEQRPPPPPPPIIPPEIVEVPDEQEIVEEIVEIDMEFDETEEIIVADEYGDEESTSEIFLIVEEQPTPIGGMKAFYEFIQKNLRYPPQASRMGVEGRVYIDFVVEKDGSLSQIGVLKGIGAGCDKEALRVMRLCPIKWRPGKQRGKPVRVRFRLPLTFRLGK